MALFERIPLEIEREIVSYLYRPRLLPRDTAVRNSPDLLNLIKCNSKLHNRYISYLYDELRFFFPCGIRDLYPPESNYNPRERYDFKLGSRSFSKMGLDSVRSFSLITRDSAVRTGYEHARDPEDEFTKVLYEAVFLPMSRNNILARLQHHRAEGKTPSYMPEILDNMSPNLVYLSIDVDGTVDGNLTAQDFDHLRFQSLQKIRLMIKPSLRNVQIAYSLLKAAPELLEVDLDFLSFLPGRVHSEDRYKHPSSDLDRKRDPETYFLECSALSGLSKLQRLIICYVDCGDLLASVKFENLADVSLKYCRNWDALAKHATNKKLRLKHLHISAEPSEIQGIKSFLDGGLEPGHMRPPFEYKVEWVDGVSQVEKLLQEDPDYYDEHRYRDQYAKPRDSAGTWRLETLDYEDYPEETNVELYHREWLEETQRKRLRRKKAQVYPVKWNPHLSEADVAKEITLGGPKAFPFKLYSAQFRDDDDMYGEISLSGLGLPMY
ncbi:hypothetical protein TWF788_008940 [Orbilia oligospora]|uniref:Uncharacterized protein n=1 Tax=Orbilia oligospora TaxID=2813651 RepID=A0A7C8PLX5_ORBOL|nr:hypothetical protein TWF788_008940 [Orbilia oligospora]